MKRRGTVLGPLDTPEDSPIAYGHRFAVALDGIDQCQRCSRGQGCGAIFTGMQAARDGVSVPCQSLTEVCRGQRVEVEIDDQGSGWLALVLGAYGLPLLGMLLATGLASVMASVMGSSVASDLASSTVSTLAGSVPGNANSDAASARWQVEVGILLAAVAGFLAGHILWRRLSARALCSVAHSLCLQSARIVDSVPCSKRDIR